MKRIKWTALACLLLMLTVLPVAAFAADETMEIRNGSVYVEADGSGWKATQGGVTKSGAMTDTLTISGVGTSTTGRTAYAISIDSVGSVAAPMQIVLDDVHIQTAYDAQSGTFNALDVNASHVTLTLAGTNTLAFKGDIKAAVRVPDTSSLTITGDGSLTAECILLQIEAACMGAAIGGNGSISGSGEACGTVKISGSVNVTATCDKPRCSGAGIGGGGSTTNGNLPGVKGGDGGTVEVSGQATVTARSNLGAGVGGGACVGITGNFTSGNGGTVTVNGGSLTASSTEGAGIGSGHGSFACGSGGSLTVQNGTVIATSTNGAGVGGGSSTHRTGGNGGSVTMTGGALRAKSANSAAIGGGNGTAIGMKGSVDLSGYTGVPDYEWSHEENGTYLVHKDITTEYLNDSSGFAGIRPAQIKVAPVNPQDPNRPDAVAFGHLAEGYTRPAAQTVTLTNRGSSDVHPVSFSPNSTYEILTPNDWTDALAAGASRSFTVQPISGLLVGNYDQVLLVAVTEASGVSIDLAFEVGIPPTITGDTELTLPVGYIGDQYTSEYSLTGTPSPNVYAYNQAFPLYFEWVGNKLKIKPGLGQGTYDVTLTAYNSYSPNDELTFTLTVGTAPTITGDTALTLVEGYAAQATGAYTLGGFPEPTVTQDTDWGGKMIWNAATKQLDIAAGMEAGSYPVELTATNGVSPDGTLTFTLTVIPPLSITVSGSSKYPVGGATESAVFHITATGAALDATHYGSATLDGQALDLGTLGHPGADGSIENGSLNVIINRAKLNTLAAGTHTLVVTLRNGAFAGKMLTGTLTVTPPHVAPKTGDNTPLLGWALLMALSCCGVALLAFRRRRSKV